MKKLMILTAVLGILAMASMSFAQNIGLTFDELGTTTVIDGRSDLVPNTDLLNLPSVTLYIIAYDIPELYGYEYNLSSTDGTAIKDPVVVYPTATAQNFGDASVGDVRVGTGICFLAGGPDAGPDPNHIRLASQRFTWGAPPTVDVLYCLGPSLASIDATGATAPQYTECTSNPVSLSFGLANQPLNGITPEGCAVVVFEWMPDPTCQGQPDCPDIPTNGERQVVDTQQKSWGSLKSSF